ncbi:MAG: translation initiation factor IF-2 associated domain-containing protein, partial [Nevskia sp.]|nr:translation initiation factor IF-2 associated domain-containing protein [Nevskia sp.]
MSTLTVSELATELHKPVAEMLAQLKEAGVPVDSEKSPISPADKVALLSHLQKNTRGGVALGGGAEPRRITLKRKETTELKLGGGRGAAAKTVSIEVRKRRTFVKHDVLEESAEGGAAAVTAAEAEAAEAQAQAQREAEARAAAEAEARRHREEQERKLQEEEQARARAAVEAAERKQAEDAERMRSDPIYRARMEAESSRRRASENLKRATEMPAQPQPAAPPPVAKKPERDKAPHRNELHLAEGRGGRREKKSKKPTGQIRVDNVHVFEKPTAPVVREVEVPEGITVGELANRMAV